MDKRSDKEILNIHMINLGLMNPENKEKVILYVGRIDLKA